MTKVLISVLLGLVFLNCTHFLYLNFFTHSLPQGIYIKIQGQPKRGDYAASCLTADLAKYGIDRQYLAPGHCPTGTVGVLKVIGGLPGDYYSVQNGFLKLNGQSYRIMSKDSLGRRLKVFYHPLQGMIGKGKYVLLSNFVPNSWDSRYWGPVPIEFLLKPLWTFEKIQR